MNHPNILQLKGVFVDMADMIYMFTELAEKGSLTNVLESDMEISNELKIEWATQIAEGMVNFNFFFSRFGL